jgi:hypothetical protein
MMAMTCLVGLGLTVLAAHAAESKKPKEIVVVGSKGAKKGKDPGSYGGWVADVERPAQAKGKGSKAKSRKVIDCEGYAHLSSSCLGK